MSIKEPANSFPKEYTESLTANNTPDEPENGNVKFDKKNSCQVNDAAAIGKLHGREVNESPATAFNQTNKHNNDLEPDANIPTEEMLLSEKENTPEFAIEYLGNEVKIIQEKILDEITERFFLTYVQGKEIDYHSWKKRAPMREIVSSIPTWFCFENEDDKLLLVQLMKLLESTGRISDLSSSLQSSLILSSVHTLNSSAGPSSSYSSPLHVPSTHQESSTVCESSTKANSSNSVPFSLMHNASSTIPALPILPNTPSDTPALRMSSRSGSMLEEPSGTREQIVEQAKQEAYVMQRIAELRKNGVWTPRRLPKVQEPHRNKVHWDYLLEEMQWLAADFLQERKWKRNSAKKCSKMVMKFHSNKDCQVERTKKEEQVKLRRIASNIAKMVKQFWSDVEKLMEHKKEVQLKEKRRKIHDMQLRYIVDKADHFTEKLAQEFVVPSIKNSRAPSVDSEQMTEQCNDAPHGIDSKANSMVELLKKESEMPLEQLADTLPEEFVESLTMKKKPDEHDDDDVEFDKGNSTSGDDEETIAKEEDQEADESVDHKNELNDLQSDANIPIEDLLNYYGYGEDTPKSEDKTEYTTADDETENTSDSDNSEEEEEDVDQNGHIGLDYLVNSSKDGLQQDGESTEAIAAAAAEAIQPKGNTLSSVEVITKVPSLLKFQLREYQHIGLDWLVAMNEKNLNGILADEMGLGKTIQTISLIAHLACDKGIWGPHLIVVPTSVMLNWEMELKKWCPGLKILTYYGNPKERRLKRKGWTKPNTFHVCITSYKLVVQDHSSFRRKKWVYFILDEAQHIKNFKSQRWQMLLNFNSSRRLLLTGTPLQNNLMELWSLMHFLMPNVFQSHREFKDWFVNPVTGMIEGNSENEEIIRRLHKILRPFLLRRLKCDVEKQLPKKTEHTIFCSLSKRQRQLYDEYMNMGKTKETLASGNFLSVINILMQLRKVCNHPNLFDPRPTVSPFIDQGIIYCIPALISSILDYRPLFQIDFSTLNLLFSHLSTELTNFATRRINQLKYDSVRMEMAWNSEPLVYARISDHTAFHRILSARKLNTSIHGTIITGFTKQPSSVQPFKSFPTNIQRPLPGTIRTKKIETIIANPSGTSEGKCQLDISQQSDVSESGKEGTLGVGKYATPETIIRIAELKKDKLRQLSSVNRHRCSLSALYMKETLEKMNFTRELNISSCSNQSEVRTSSGGYSSSIFSLGSGYTHCRLSQDSNDDYRNSTNFLDEILYTPETYEASLRPTLNRFLCIIPNVISYPIKLQVTHLPSYKMIDQCNFEHGLSKQLSPNFFDVIKVPRINLRFQLPELRLIQYDCGKLQILEKLLWNLKAGKHRILIFTQMSRMLDIFEQFLNYHGHTYLRLDGSTKIEQRQAMMERFNADQRIFCFILSTRSGGVGVNLTGADTVIFYDSDWNPTMDAQAQDRCHRIGQTRDVNIYRLVSVRTVEENILQKARQKKLLGDLAIEEGNFTTAFFKQAAIKDLFDVDQTGSSNNNNNSTTAMDTSEPEQTTDSTLAESNSLRTAFEQALGTAEEATDVDAAKVVRAEAAAEFNEFDENIPIEDISDEKSPEEEQIEQVISQLMPVERYALQYFESLQDFQELKQAEEEIEETKKQWQDSIKEWRKNHEDERRNMRTEFQDSVMTCTREDSSIEQVFMSINGFEPMPIWAPPTPPQDENDLYMDHSLGFLYEKTLMPESQLPPIFIPKEHNKRLRVDVAQTHGRKHVQLANASSAHVHQPLHAGPVGNKSTRRTDDLYTIPKSPFDRSTSLIIRFRRELLITKTKLWPGSSNLISSIQRTLTHMGNSVSPPSNLASLQSLAKAHYNASLFPPWLINEEFSIIMVLVYLQDLPHNLSIICPGHTPNWDLVAEQVNTYNSYKRSPKVCKYHFDSLMAAKDEPRHLGDTDSPKTSLQSHMFNAKQSKSTKKNKNQSQSALVQQMSPFLSSSQSITLNPSMPNASIMGGPGKASTTSPMTGGNTLPTTTQPLHRISNILKKMVTDNNMEYTNEMNKRFDAIKQIIISKTQTSKSRFNKHQPKVSDQVNLLINEYDIKYDKPLSVKEVADIRAERISKDKQAAREQQARDQQTRDGKACVTSNSGTSQFHSPSTMSSPSVMASAALAVGSSSHLQQQQSSPQVLISQVSAVAGLLQQPQGQSSPVLINQVPASPSQSPAFIASPLQHVLATKKMQGHAEATSVANLNTKMFSTHVVNMSSSPANVHQVAISQAQSLALLSGQNVNTISTMSDATGSLPSALQQHLQSQQASVANSQQGAQQQFMQMNQPGQPISVNVAITNQAHLQSKILATITPNASNSLTPSSPMITQASQLGTPARVPLIGQYKQQPNRNQHQMRQQLAQQQQSLSGGAGHPRHVNMQTIRSPMPGNSPRYQISAVGATAVSAPLNQTMISSAGLKQVMTTTIANSTSLAGSHSAASLIGTTQRILTSTATTGQLIASTVGGSMIATNKVTGSNASIITRTIRTDNLASPLHAAVSGAQSSLGASTMAVPIAGNQLRQIQLLQKRASPAMQSMSSTGSPQQQLLMHKAIIPSNSGTHSLVVSDGQSPPATVSTANIISPLLQSSGAGTIGKSPNTYHLVPMPQQSGPITMTTKAVLTSSPMQMQQALKHGQIIVPSANSGQVAQSANHLASAPSLLAQQQQSAAQAKNNSGQQHFIAVTSTDSQSAIPVNATFKLLPNSAGLALQQGQQGTSIASSLPGSISTTPKGHIIISGHPASLVGQSGAGAMLANTTASSHLASPTLLQQVVSNQSCSTAGQTLTFAIRTAPNQQLSAQPPSGPVHHGALTRKTAAQGTSLATCQATSNVTSQQPSALVAALSQTTHSHSSEPSCPNVAGGNAALLRTLGSNVSTKGIPIVLMQSPQNATLVGQRSTVPASSVSLLNFSNSTNPMSSAPSRSVFSSKITTSTQTSGATLGSILSAAPKLVPSAEAPPFATMLTSSPSSSSRVSESPLIEALMSPIGKLPRSCISTVQQHSQPKPEESQTDSPAK